MSLYPDLQSVFDASARHLLTQRRVSTIPRGTGETCAYRGTDGLRCAIGALIPDDLYDVGMEGTNIATVRDNYPNQWRALFPDDAASLLAALQTCHDRIAVDDWAGRLRDTAQRFGLSTRLLDEAV